MDEKTFFAVLPLLSCIVGFAPCSKRSSITSTLLSAEAASKGVLVENKNKIIKEGLALQ